MCIRDSVYYERNKHNIIPALLCKKFISATHVCSDAEKLTSLGCDHVFSGHVTRWLNVLRYVVLQRVHRAIQMDAVRTGLVPTYSAATRA